MTLNHPPAGPREEQAARRMDMIERWCERNVADLFNRFSFEEVVGTASAAGKAGKLTPAEVRERLERW